MLGRLLDPELGNIRHRTRASTARMTWAASTLSAAIFWAKEPSEQPKSGKNRQVI
ncbi:unnamed protein product [Oikopleura dioica]|uniref:Uncharacterized protein n=1 Tax=Oikopleura dioica TaxID=34765 RepID=E4YTW0_OIKDI|nr:unnamed protein product [Oikopleura dioica]